MHNYLSGKSGAMLCRSLCTSAGGTRPPFCASALARLYESAVLVTGTNRICSRQQGISGPSWHGAPSVRHLVTLCTPSPSTLPSSWLCSHANSADKCRPFPLFSYHLEPKRTFSQSRGAIVSFNLSDIGEGISEVVIKEWFVKEGDRVNQFDSICEVQSDKASVTITSRYDGIVHKIYYSIEDIAKVGKPLVDILLDIEASTVDNNARVDVVDEMDERNVDRLDNYSAFSQILTTPAVRRLAMEHKINLKDVIGTGKDGRILKEDVLNYISMAQQPKAEPKTAFPQVSKENVQSKPTVVSAPLPTPSILPDDRVEPIKGITKSMFKTMTNSLNVPHFGLCEEVDLTELVRLRPQMKKLAQERNISLSYMPFMIKAASLALTEFPILNASVDPTGEKIVFKGGHNIGVAMDTKQGLLVPNIKKVNQLSVLEIARELGRLHELGKKGQLGTEDLSGGTFTLSNIGSIGGIFGIPVLMPSEVAIGAIGRLRQVPRFVDDSSDRVERASVLQVLWSADHRIIDGATMTRFSNRWKSYLENPLRIFL